MHQQIVAQDEANVTTFPDPLTSVASIAYRPRGRRHPEQYKALLDGRYVDVTAASARMVIDLARDFSDYRYGGLRRGGEANDGGRRWWHYDFTPNNDFARFLVEVRP
jgi:hypothetical protein